MVVAHKSRSEEIGILRKVFQKFDTRGDGLISFDEFSKAMGSFGSYSDSDLRAVFDAVVSQSLFLCSSVQRLNSLGFLCCFQHQDMDGTGRVRYTEFLAATIETQGVIEEARLAEAFDSLDSNDSGFISAENLIEILGNDFPREEIDAIIAEVSSSQEDNRISYGDFLTLWESEQELVKEENQVTRDCLSPSLSSDEGGTDIKFFLEKHVHNRHHSRSSLLVQ